MTTLVIDHEDADFYADRDSTKHEHGRESLYIYVGRSTKIVFHDEDDAVAFAKEILRRMGVDVVTPSLSPSPA